MNFDQPKEKDKDPKEVNYIGKSGAVTRETIQPGETEEDAIERAKKIDEDSFKTKQKKIEFMAGLESNVEKINIMMNSVNEELSNYNPSDVLKRKLLDAKLTELQNKIRGITFNPNFNDSVSEKINFELIQSSYLNLLEKKSKKEEETQFDS
ncbi:MAG: hypothetical protein WC577_02595 [Candidatus Paceibacterota bacterium]